MGLEFLTETIQAITGKKQKESNRKKAEEEKWRIRHSVLAQIFLALEHFQQSLNCLPEISRWVGEHNAKVVSPEKELIEAPKDNVIALIQKEFKELLANFDDLLKEVETGVERILNAVRAYDPANPTQAFVASETLSHLSMGHRYPRPGEPRRCEPDDLREVLIDTQTFLNQHLEMLQNLSHRFPGNHQEVRAFEVRVETIMRNIETIFTHVNRIRPMPAASNDPPGYDRPAPEASDDPPGYDDPYYDASGNLVQPQLQNDQASSSTRPSFR